MVSSAWGPPRLGPWTWRTVRRTWLLWPPGLMLLLPLLLLLAARVLWTLVWWASRPPWTTWTVLLIQAVQPDKRHTCKQISRCPCSYLGHSLIFVFLILERML